MNPWEVAANAFNALSIVLAGRNNVQTWWTGIVGCFLFGWVFFAARLYADATLQGFFILTSALGWVTWEKGGGPAGALPVRRSRTSFVVLAASGAAIVAAAYAWLLHRFTDAFAPLADSLVMAFSVLGQLLLMARRLETWWCWLFVNAIAVPLYTSRSLYLTALLYAAFWVNALISLRRWKELAAS